MQFLPKTNRIQTSFCAAAILAAACFCFVKSPVTVAGVRCVRAPAVVGVQAPVAVATVATPQTLIQRQNVFLPASASSLGGYGLGPLDGAQQQQTFSLQQQILREQNRLAEKMQALQASYNRLAGPNQLNAECLALLQALVGQQRTAVAPQPMPNYQRREPLTPRRTTVQTEPRARTVDVPTGRRFVCEEVETRSVPEPRRDVHDLPEPRPRFSLHAGGDGCSVVERHCLRCHNERVQRAGLRLDQPISELQARKARVLVRSGEMPPDVRLSNAEIMFALFELRSDAEQQQLYQSLIDDEGI